MSEEKQRTYIAIDLKSFYASVECDQRDLDPLKTNLVVADNSRTEKTICLAVSPSLKSYGIPGRARLFEVVQKVKEVNAMRIMKAPGFKFTGKSCDDTELKNNPSLAVDFIIAPPQMAYYMKYSGQIYNTYLKYVAPEDIHVYSIDEVFIDATDYLKLYDLTAHELAMKMIRDVLGSTGITATAGIGTNMYLAKIAMDIVAKHIPPDEDGVRIAELDEMSYREKLWNHRPLTDFWRVGRGYARKLEAKGLYTMGDIARCSVGGERDFYNEDLLYKMFGVNAELLIDHAWGWEPCTIKEIKAYKPEASSIASGQVLQSPYTNEKALLVTKEMADMLALDLMKKHLVTNQLVLTVGYDIENLSNPEIASKYKGNIVKDFYGRLVPEHAHGTANLKTRTASSTKIVAAVAAAFEKLTDKNLLVRRISISANNVMDEEEAARLSREEKAEEQLDMFSLFNNDSSNCDKNSSVENSTNRAAKNTDTNDSYHPWKTRENSESVSDESDEKAEEKERSMQQALLDIKEKFGKNAVLKGMNFEEGATAAQRNKQIGGHRSGE